MAFANGVVLYEEVSVWHKNVASETMSEPVPSNWSEVEAWAWERITAGRAADLRRYPGKSDQESMPVLSVAFVRDLLSREALSKRLPSQGVQIVGARFTESFDLSYTSVDRLLVFAFCRFDEGMVLLSFRSTKDLSLIGSQVSGDIELEGSRIDGLLAFGNVSAANITMRRAKIGGQADLNDVICSGSMLLEGLQVDGQLNLRGSSAQSVLLHGARLARLDMTSFDCQGLVSLDDLQVTTQLTLGAEALVAHADSTQQPGFMPMDDVHARDLPCEATAPSRFGSLSIVAARVGSNIDLTGARIAERLTLDSSRIGGHLFLRYATMKSLDLYSTNVGSTIDLRFADVHRSLDLRQASSMYFLDHGFDWPSGLQLDGFQYQQLVRTVASRPVKWFRQWLSKQESYTPQPYHKLAQVLVAAGDREKAESILYAGRNREMAQAGWRRRVWLLLLWGTIGYGFKIHRALIWVVAFTAIGVWVLGHSDVAGLGPSLVDRTFYTLDALLPIISLDKVHDAVRVGGEGKYYFYFLRVAGWVLGSFLVAGLAGFTKK